MRKLLLVLAVLALAAPPAFAADAPARALRVESRFEKGAAALERRILLDVSDASGKPVDGARIEIHVDMPSMPMMHAVPKATALPGGAPGRYSATVKLEMPGAWSARIEILAPGRQTVVRRFVVDN